MYGKHPDMMRTPKHGKRTLKQVVGSIPLSVYCVPWCVGSIPDCRNCVSVFVGSIPLRLFGSQVYVFRFPCFVLRFPCFVERISVFVLCVPWAV
jgi:hypothetical protein